MRNPTDAYITAAPKYLDKIRSQLLRLGIAYRENTDGIGVGSDYFEIQVPRNGYRDIHKALAQAGLKPSDYHFGWGSMNESGFGWLNLPLPKTIKRLLAKYNAEFVSDGKLASTLDDRKVFAFADAGVAKAFVNSVRGILPARPLRSDTSKVLVYIGEGIQALDESTQLYRIEYSFEDKDNSVQSDVMEMGSLTDIVNEYDTVVRDWMTEQSWDADSITVKILSCPESELREFKRSLEQASNDAVKDGLTGDGRGHSWENQVDIFIEVDMQPITENQDLANLKTMSLSEIAALIKKDWNPVHAYAKPYLGAMATLEKITDNYIADSGYSVVAYFLSNANSWKGDVAKAVKAELKRRLKNA